VLREASAYVRAGGRIVYVTCSLFAEENEDRVAVFVAEHPSFAIAAGRRLTPRGEETDGFYVAELIKSQIVD
jgi:16S rRNA (cytosine967-C5)-methyltransferase